MVKNPPASARVQETWVRSLGQEDPQEEELAPHSSIPTWEIPWTEEPGGLQCMGCKELDMTVHTYREGNGTPLQYSCLENPMDGGAWWAAVHGVAKRRTRLSDFPFTFHFHALEKEMATHSSVLARRIPGAAEPGRLPSMGLHRIRHDWSDSAAAAAAAAFSLPKGWN